MRKLAGLFGGMLLLTWWSVAAEDNPSRVREPERNFDEYGLIRWGDEQARLDNFAIQLQSEPDAIGYIFVFDGSNVCEGEARARAIRARDYVKIKNSKPGQLN